jgi:hypothetical protein
MNPGKVCVVDATSAASTTHIRRIKISGYAAYVFLSL